MFRLLQGDVGSGKTIVALSAAYNVIDSGFQVAVMAPTEILARQHYNLAKKIFDQKISIEFLSSKSDYKDKKIIRQKLENKEIDIIFGTHSIFQKKIIFKKLGLIIIDELVGEYDLLAAQNVEKVNIFTRLIKSLNYLIWGDV